MLLGHYGDAKKFLYSSFSQFGVAATMAWFTSHDLPLVVQAGKRAFPKTERATDVVRVLEKNLQHGRVEVQTGVMVDGFTAADDKIVGIMVADKKITADSYILATGGASHPRTGSTGDGFRWLRDLGYDVEPPSPMVVPLNVPDYWVRSLAGVALDGVKVTFFVDGQKKLVVRGRILCTHFGLSGPTILNSAANVADLLQTGVVTASVDLFPTLDLGALNTKAVAVFDANKNRELKNVMKLIAPAGTAAAILDTLPTIDPEEKVHSVSKEERKMIVHRLKSMPLTVAGLMGAGRAVVTDGGLSIHEVDGKTMRLRRHANLFVTGDMFNINRPSGGYSLQLCWTTGWVAGSNA